MSKTVVATHKDAPAFPVIAEWCCGDETLIQCDGFRREPMKELRVVDGKHRLVETGEFFWDEDMSWHEDMTGKQADKEIADALQRGCKPVIFDGDSEVRGYYESEDYKVIYSDCDECTYDEYYGEEAA